MKNYSVVQAETLRATMDTTAISDLKEECTVIVNKHPMAARCFRCLGNIFCKVENPNRVTCSFCHAEYEIK